LYQTICIIPYINPTFHSDYVTFLNKLNSHFSSANKKYYVTAAPQCVYPDASLQTTLNGYPFDAVYVQFCMYFLALIWDYMH
jgi:hypothetical protein